LQPRQRDVNSVDGDTTLQELVGDCPRCRKSFFRFIRLKRTGGLKKCGHAYPI